MVAVVVAVVVFQKPVSNVLVVTLQAVAVAVAAEVQILTAAAVLLIKVFMHLVMEEVQVLIVLVALVAPVAVITIVVVLPTALLEKAEMAVLGERLVQQVARKPLLTVAMVYIGQVLMAVAVQAEKPPVVLAHISLGQPQVQDTEALVNIGKSYDNYLSNTQFGPINRRLCV